MQPKPEIVYSSHSFLRQPGKLLAEMFRDLLNSRELAWRLLLRNTSAAYRQSLLGYFWAVAPPIAMTLTWVMLKRGNVFSIGETALPYPAYVMIGTILWAAFTESVTEPIAQVRNSKSMLAKINFPREALILASLGQVTLNFLIKIVLLIGVFFWYKISFTAPLIFAPLAVLSLMILGLALSLMLMPFAILFGDVSRAVTMILGFWFFFTPIVYPPPQHWPMSLLTKYNPVSPLIISARELIVGSPLSHAAPALWVTAIAAVTVFMGWILYRVAMPHLIERMSN